MFRIDLYHHVHAIEFFYSSNIQNKFLRATIFRVIDKCQNDNDVNCHPVNPICAVENIYWTFHPFIHANIYIYMGFGQLVQSAKAIYKHGTNVTMAARNKTDSLHLSNATGISSQFVCKTRWFVFCLILFFYFGPSRSIADEALVRVRDFTYCVWWDVFAGALSTFLGK